MEILARKFRVRIDVESCTGGDVRAADVLGGISRFHCERALCV